MFPGHAVEGPDKAGNIVRNPCEYRLLRSHPAIDVHVESNDLGTSDSAHIPTQGMTVSLLRRFLSLLLLAFLAFFYNIVMSVGLKGVIGIFTPSKLDEKVLLPEAEK